jgi:hypothetical protein
MITNKNIDRRQSLKSLNLRSYFSYGPCPARPAQVLQLRAVLHDLRRYSSYGLCPARPAQVLQLRALSCTTCAGTPVTGSVLHDLRRYSS